MPRYCSRILFSRNNIIFYLLLCLCNLQLARPLRRSSHTHLLFVAHPLFLYRKLGRFLYHRFELLSLPPTPFSFIALTSGLSFIRFPSAFQNLFAYFLPRSDVPSLEMNSADGSASPPFDADRRLFLRMKGYLGES